MESDQVKLQIEGLTEHLRDNPTHERRVYQRCKSTVLAYFCGTCTDRQLDPWKAFRESMIDASVHNVHTGFSQPEGSSLEEVNTQVSTENSNGAISI